jgi:hypothetical protein
MVAMTAPAERYCPSCERSYHEGARCPADGTELVMLGAAPADPLLGRSLNDRYTINEKLGSGGMGTVYRGLQHSVGRDVAIKVVNAALVTNPDVIKRFLREAKLSSRLSHPNAVSILDFGQTPDGLFFLVMELLEGRTLDKVLKLDGRFRLPRVVRVGAAICEALEGAHRLSIVHRDLKPANVMVLDGTDGRDLVKVLDFGLAKSLSQDTTGTTMTMSGALLGTPAYMSPEAARGAEVDERGDLYSLGCILYVLASGRVPFQSDSIHELLSMHTNVTPPPLSGVPAPVAAVIMRLLAKDPVERFRTAAATRHALEEAALPFISSELASAVATTMPGRKKSMPPADPVPMNAPTLNTLAAGMVNVATRAAQAQAQATAETITPVTTAALATPAPFSASVVPGTPVAAVPTPMAIPESIIPAAAVPSAPEVVTAVTRPAPRSRRMPAILAGVAVAAVAIAVVIIARTSGGDDETKKTPAAGSNEVAPSAVAAPPQPVTPPSDPVVIEQPVTPPAIDAGAGSAEATIAKPPRTIPPRVRPPKAEPPKAEPPKTEPPKVEPPKAEPPKTEPPKPPKTTPW